MGYENQRCYTTMFIGAIVCIFIGFIMTSVGNTAEVSVLRVFGPFLLVTAVVMIATVCIIRRKQQQAMITGVNASYQATGGVTITQTSNASYPAPTQPATIGYPPQQPGSYPPEQPGSYPPQQPGSYPPPTTYPSPAGQPYPPPAGQQYPPPPSAAGGTQPYPPPAGQPYPPPAGQPYPPPAGQPYPPPAGQPYPPPQTASYPPPGGVPLSQQAAPLPDKTDMPPPPSYNEAFSPDTSSVPPS